jgi:vanadium chloroperoxidase
MQPILFWNEVALETHRRDFAGGKPQVGGPTRVSRALAIVHAAIYNAQEATAPRPGGPRYYQPVLVPPAMTPMGPANAAGAVAGAAVAVLKRIWPAEQAFLDEKMQQFCDARIAAGAAGRDLMDGANYGELIGLAMHAHRASDGHERPDENVFVNQPGHHQPDPAQASQPRLSTHWGLLRPFLIPVAGNGYVNHALYLAPPPPLGSPRDLAAVADVQALGRARSLHPMPGQRTPEQTTVGVFWGYDGPPPLGVPPRLYNQVVRAFVLAQAAGGVTLSDAEAAQLFAQVNFAMADAAIVAWGAKYHYDLWRPVVGIRQGAPGLGPAHGAYQGPMPATADPAWLPLGIPRTDQAPERHFTPDFPAYPSGHATFGAAACRVTALFYAQKRGLPVGEVLRQHRFEFISDEYDGQHRGDDGALRPRVNKSLSLAQAIVDNAVSRVYLGVHWRYDGLGAVAPDGLEGEPLPPDPAHPVKLPDAQEKRLGGVPAGLMIADQVVAALP